MFFILDETFFDAHMAEIVNKFVLAGDKFMPEKYLCHSRLVYSACEYFLQCNEFVGGCKYLTTFCIAY